MWKQNYILVDEYFFFCCTWIVNSAPNKDEPIHLYCRSGRRSELALIELKKLGYTNVTNHGGYAELIQKGLK